MFLPEQTSGPSSSSSPSSSRTVPRPSTASSSLSTPTPPPTYHIRPVLDQQQRPNYLDQPHYGMNFNNPSDPFLIASSSSSSLSGLELDARRLRAHGKRRERDVELATRGGCVNLPNSQLSCQPYPGEQIMQNSWFEFQWNSWHPLFNQVDDVSIYLFNGDSGQQIGHWVENKRQGSIQINANDTFWGAAGSQIQPGHNQSFPFYFVILPTTATVHQGESTEPAFTGIQTALPNSVLALSASSALSIQSALSTASAYSTLASMSALSSLSSVSSASVLSTGRSPTGAVRNNSGGGGFPGWGIALVVILASLLLLAALLGAYLVMRRIRRNRRRKEIEDEDHRRSVGSSSPMIPGGPRGMAEPTSPTSIGHGGIPSTAEEKAGLLGAGVLGASAGGAAANARHQQHDHQLRESASLRGAPVVLGPGPGTNISYTNDGASIMSGSDNTSTAPGMLSGADAMIVADAFRQAMRNPDLSGRPVEEDESPPEEKATNPVNEKVLISEELKREGRDIRTVPSARDVRVQGTSGEQGGGGSGGGGGRI